MQESETRAAALDGVRVLDFSIMLAARIVRDCLLTSAPRSSR